MGYAKINIAIHKNIYIVQLEALTVALIRRGLI
jgi:hypothetical protein